MAGGGGGGGELIGSRDSRAGVSIGSMSKGGGGGKLRRGVSYIEMRLFGQGVRELQRPYSWEAKIAGSPP